MNTGGNPNGGPAPLETHMSQRGMPGVRNFKAGFTRPSSLTAGFTLIETLIVLAVTSALFVSAVVVINGRQNKTEFATAINGMQQQLQQIINETASGFFPDTNSFTCTAGATGQPTISAVSGAGQGTNTGCVFLGKVVQFGVKPVGDPDTYAIHTIAGNRSATTLAAADPIDVWDASNGITDILSLQNLEFGLTVDHMTFVDAAGGGGDTAGVGFLAGDKTGLISVTDSSGLASGALQLSLYRVKSTKVGNDAVNDMANKINASSSDLQPIEEADICFSSGTTNQSGLITIGGSGSQLTVSLKIKGNLTCA